MSEQQYRTWAKLQGQMDDESLTAEREIELVEEISEIECRWTEDELDAAQARCAQALNPVVRLSFPCGQ